MSYLLPPAGTQIPINILVKSIGSLFAFGTRSDNFSLKITQYLNAEHCLVLNSGRTAICLILNALSQIKDKSKKEVIIPAYTCFSVPAAIVKSGLKIRLVDVDLTTLDYDYNQLEKQDFSKVLAVIGCNLFGIINNWDRLHSLAKQNDFFLIDDAAQSFGSKTNNSYSGTFGDVGILSFDRGKNLSAYSGGAIITKDENIFQKINKQLDIESASISDTISVLIKIILSNIFMNPYCYRIPYLLPFLKLGETIYDQSFKTAHLTKLQDTIGSCMLEHLESLNSSRMQTAYKIIEQLSQIDSVKTIGTNNEIKYNYLRLPILVSDVNKRDELIKRLFDKNISSSSMYPSTIKNIYGIENSIVNYNKSFTNADQVVRRLITLPTHKFVNQDAIDNIIACLKL